MDAQRFPWQHNRRYNDFPGYFKRKFSQRVQKLSINAGFTCPNRDGIRGKGGCTYCNNSSFNPFYCSPERTISEQINQGIAFFAEKYKTQKYLAYFQAYSNTYGTLNHLKKLYNEALANKNVVGLVIGTRPDCVTPEILDYLEELAKECYVSVEYGVESCNDTTLKFINRGHTYAETVQAIQLTANRGIHIGAHLIFGLPGDDIATMIDNAVKVSELPVNSLKLHHLQVLKDTYMARQYKIKPELFKIFSLDEYIGFIVNVIEKINPGVMIERFINQVPIDWLIAPKWGVKNFEFVAKVEKHLKEKDTWQGRLYNLTDKAI